MGSSFIHLIRTDSNEFFLMAGSIETSILSRVKQITSPGGMRETSAQGWCSGKTQRDEMGREEGGGIRMGTHVNP